MFFIPAAPTLFFLVLQLKFDGSLRAPIDPAATKYHIQKQQQQQEEEQKGTRRQRTRSLSSSSISSSLSSPLLPSLATCAAALHVFHDKKSSNKNKNKNKKRYDDSRFNDDTTSTSTKNVNDHKYEENDLLALGGGFILPHHEESSTTTRITSADVEYEALLLGLNGLYNMMQQHQNQQQHHDNETLWNTLMKGNEEEEEQQQQQDETIHIVIQGDCKTVIDQMNQKSQPRKQRIYYDKAQILIQQIKKVTSSIRIGVVSFRFEHVLRNENQLCDSMCSIVRSILQTRQIHDYQSLIHRTTTASTASWYDGRDKEEEDGIQTSSSSSISYNNESLRGHQQQQLNFTTLSKKKRLQSKKSPVLTLLRLLYCQQNYGKYVIPLSFRPYFLCQLAILTLQSQDYIGLRLVGEYIMNDTYMVVIDTSSSSTTTTSKKGGGEGQEEEGVTTTTTNKNICHENTNNDQNGVVVHVSQEVMEVFGMRMYTTSLIQMKLNKEAKAFIKKKKKNHTQEPGYSTSSTTKNSKDSNAGTIRSSTSGISTTTIMEQYNLLQLLKCITIEEIRVLQDVLLSPNHNLTDLITTSDGIVPDDWYGQITDDLLKGNNSCWTVLPTKRKKRRRQSVGTNKKE